MTSIRLGRMTRPDIDPMTVVYVVSFLLHIALVRGVSTLESHPRELPTQIVSIALPAPTEPEPEPELLPEPEPEPATEAPAPTPPAETPPPPAPRPPAEPRAAAPEPAAPEAAPAPGVLASNLVLGGTVQVAAGDGSSGVSTGAEPRPRTAQPRRLEAAPEPTRARTGGCAEDPSRPRPLTLPRPSFTNAARAAGIEGRVRLRVHVAADGSIARIEVLEGLGHGLDEAAERAVREARFEPGLACERAVETSVVLSIRFTASA